MAIRKTAEQMIAERRLIKANQRREAQARASEAKAIATASCKSPKVSILEAVRKDHRRRQRRNRAA